MACVIRRALLNVAKRKTRVTSTDLPAFGEADLSNCEREQIHLAGSIQPHGALLVLDDAAETIVQASANAGAFLNLGEAVVGRNLTSLPGTLAARLRAKLDAPLHRRPVALSARIGEASLAVDALVHRPADGGVVVELEHAAEPLAVRAHLDEATRTILNASSLRALGDETAELFKALTGYDRVMVYRFDEFGHGEVFSERREPEREAFLGNRYPASDIPHIARRLYLETRARLLVDVEAVAVPIVPRLSPESGRELDMSMCALRSMSPVHLQYLKNMGVRATLVVSIVVAGELWGLVACHHYSPKVVCYAMRALGELIGELVATRVAALESFVQTQSELVVRRLEQRMIDAIGRDGDWRTALFDGSGALLTALGAGGAALVYEGQVQTAGDVPATARIREIVAWLDGQPREPILATTTLGRDAPAFAPLADVATGVLAAPISASPGEYLVWFRPERVRTVVWGGDPRKPVLVGTDPRQLSPRLSFAQWHERVEGTSDPWTLADRQTARLVARTIADMVLQFRAVRMLIAQDQLDTLSRQVRQSAQPMLVAGPSGRVLLVNAAFGALLEPGHASLRMLEDLPSLFTEPLSMARHLEELAARDRPWRGEASLERASGTPRPLTVRAEPVYASAERKLGYIIHVEETADRQAADVARRHFHDGMVDRRLLRVGRLDGAAERDYRELLSSVIENAQLAALEITYGDDADGMPRMLDSVRTSVARTAELLEQLLWHAGEIEG